MTESQLDQDPKLVKLTLDVANVAKGYNVNLVAAFLKDGSLVVYGTRTQ